LQELQRIENKDKVILQKDGIILDLKDKMNDSYKLQEIQLIEMKDTFEQRIDEANAIINELNEKMQDSAVPPELKAFLKYATYSKNYKASLKEGFTDEETAIIGKKTSSLYIFASGAGDSLHGMLKNVKALIDKNPNALIVDLSNDYFLNVRYRIQTKDSSMMLNDKDIELGSIVKEINGTKIIPTTFYNDIALLSMDWATIIKKLMVYASGKPIILLFNNVNSFSVRYTVSKLATIGQLFVFAKSNPVVLSTLLGDLKFIPNQRVKVVATDYIDVVQAVLEQVAKTYAVTTFKEGVVWSKLGIKL
jgi:hypothetical protein